MKWNNLKHVFVLSLLSFSLCCFSACKNNNTDSGLSGKSEESILSRDLLNSERITKTFGNYGIEVLKADSRLRISNLYSTHRDVDITRTYAVVLYPEQIDTALSKEHEKIVEGGSIGKVFKEAGWDIEKNTLFFDELQPSPEYSGVYQLMGGIEESPLGMYTYIFNVKKTA